MHNPFHVPFCWTLTNIPPKSFTPESMVRMAFHDATDTLPKSTKAGWARFGPRRLFHYAVDIMEKVAKVAPEAAKAQWSQVIFVEALGKAMCHRKRGGDPDNPDNSGYILWRTDAKRFVRYESLKAMIVGVNIHQKLSLPTRKRKEMGQFNFAEVETDDRNNFFRYINVNNAPTQVNDILFGRIFMCINKTHPEEECKTNNPSWKMQYPNITTRAAINLGTFWPTTKSFLDAFRDFQKKKLKKDYWDKRPYLVNESSWAYPNNGSIYPFLYPDDVEYEMDGYLALGNNTKAVMFALQGYITENFLLWMVRMKKYYSEVAKKQPHSREVFQCHAFDKKSKRH
jgi:hypothetical protein